MAKQLARVDFVKKIINKIHTHTQTLTHSHTHTLTHTLTHSLTHSLTHTHTHSHTHSLSIRASLGSYEQVLRWTPLLEGRRTIFTRKIIRK